MYVAEKPRAPHVGVITTPAAGPSSATGMAVTDADTDGTSVGPAAATESEPVPSGSHPPGEPAAEFAGDRRRGGVRFERRWGKQVDAHPSYFPGPRVGRAAVVAAALSGDFEDAQAPRVKARSGCPAG